MMSHLTRGKLNIGLVHEQAKKEFLDLLDKCVGTKTIIWDDGISGPFGLIAEYSLLKSREVTKMLLLGPGRLPEIDTKNVIFITRSQLMLMNYVAENIHSCSGSRAESDRKGIKWHIFFVPFESLLCTEHLKNKGVYGSITAIEEISACSIFPFDSDLLSMEITSSFKDYYIDNDPTCLFQIAKTLLMLQDIYGPIRRVCGKGDSAIQVWKLTSRLSKEQQDNNSICKQRPTHSQIDQLLLLDRGVDLITPLATQLTYEGLIDELYGINNCSIKLPAEKFLNEDIDLTDIAQKKKTIILNSTDEIFSEIRDKNFQAVGNILSRKVKQMSAQLDERHNKTTLQGIKQFVSKLPHMFEIKKCLSDHTRIAEMIMETKDSDEFLENVRIEHEIILGFDTDKVHPYIEDLIAHKYDIVKVLRLICLQSAVNSGLKPKVLEEYKRDIVQTYGLRHILTLSNLEKAGLLKLQQGARGFTVLRKTLKLTTVNNDDDISPHDINYVHSIYAPLTVRLAQHVAKSGSWRSLSDVISLIPGALLDQTINQTPSMSSAIIQGKGNVSSQNDSGKVILIFFIGGCTFAEISALRFLSQQEELNVDFVIATTKIINGNSFIKCLMESI